jgi:hypothetical protein
MVPLNNQFLFVVTSNDFVTFKIAVTSNCNGKMGYGFKSSWFLLPVREGKCYTAATF